VTATVLVKGIEFLLPLLSRIAIPLRWKRRRAPLVLPRRTGRWLILIGRWASRRRILARWRAGGRWIALIRWRKAWDRERIIRVLWRVLSLEAWAWEPVESE